MSTKVVVVDYGLGNLFSLRRALEHLGFESTFVSKPDEVEAAESLILPGVGAFGDGMRNLRQRGLVEPIRRHAASGKPLLGICLGMQLLLAESDEFGHHEGLGLIPGRVVRFKDASSAGPRYKVPHVGWSPLSPRSGSALLEGIPDGEFMYFVHSFYAVPDAPTDALALTSYGGHNWCSVVGRRSVVGCQFHPEKSGEAGLRILRNFLS